MNTKIVSQIILGAISLLFIASGIANEIKLGKLQKEGIAVEGRILEKGELGESMGIRTHYFKVEFKRNSGDKEVKVFPVDQNDFDQASQMGVEVVIVTYVSDDPGLSRIGTHFGYNRMPLYVTILVFILIIVAIGVIQSKKGHNKALDENSRSSAPRTSLV